MDLEPVAHRGFPSCQSPPPGRRAACAPQPLRGSFLLGLLTRGLQGGIRRHLSLLLICKALLRSAGGPWFLRLVALCASGFGHCGFRALTPRGMGVLVLFGCWLVSAVELVLWQPRPPRSCAGMCMEGGRMVRCRGAAPLLPVVFSQEVS